MTAVYAAQNRFEYEQASMEAKAQERVVNKLYIEYHAKAKEVERLWRENGNEAPAKGTQEDRIFKKALAVKADAERAWQREAHRHGAMYVNLKRPDQQQAPKEETVW